MSSKNKIILFITVVLVGIGIDRVTKDLAKAYLQDQPSTSYLGDIFRIVYVENTGAFLSFGDSWPDWLSFLVMSVLPLLVLSGVCIYSFMKLKELNAATLLSLSLIVSGGIGNVIDRIAFDRHVTDFMNLGIGGLRTGIFNFADVWVTFGIVLLLIITLRQPATKPETPENPEGAS